MYKHINTHIFRRCLINWRPSHNENENEVIFNLQVLLKYSHMIRTDRQKKKTINRRKYMHKLYNERENNGMLEFLCKLFFTLISAKTSKLL